MKTNKRWAVLRGKLFAVIGVLSLFVVIFLPNNVPAGLTPLLVLFGVGFIVLAVPWRIWRNLPTWFHRDDTWF